MTDTKKPKKKVVLTPDAVIQDADWLKPLGKAEKPDKKTDD